MKRVQHVNPAFSDNFFSSFKKLEFDGSTKRDIVIPSHVLAHLKCLEELNVHNCKAAQLIFDIDDSKANTNGLVSQLKILTLVELPNLKCVWNKNPHGIISFPNLNTVCVRDCGCLVTLFPLSIATNLEKLKSLEIQKCGQLIEIVGKEDALMELETTQTLFQFPCLLNLILCGLPALSWFYAGQHHLECPTLQTLNVLWCPKLKVFTPQFDDSHKGTVIEAPIKQLQQPLFSVEKVVPKLKGLTVNEEKIMLLSDGRLPQHLLSNLNYLEMSFEDTLPFDFLQRVPYIEHLAVSVCPGLTEIFPSQKLQFHEQILSRLKIITLFDLRELESIGLEYPWVKPYSENLQTLYLDGCPRLEKLVCGAVSFVNLKELDVTDCERMEYLFTFSTAKTLVQLEMLDIDDCESIREIVKKEDEDASHVIIFGRLTTLRLDSLPKLGRFYSGNASLQFSRLQDAKVVKCPNMKTFSEGDVDAPLFHGINTSMEDPDLTFHHDLNSTIHSLFHQPVLSEYSKDIKHEDYPEMEEGVGHGKPAFPNLFGSIKKLNIKSSFKRYIVIPSNVLPFLKCLEELNVQDCTAEVIFDIDDSETKTKQNIVSPLKILTLENLSNLKCVWNKDPRGMIRFPNLQKVSVDDCRSLATMFPSSIARDLGKLEELEILRCDELVEIVGKEDALMELETTQILLQFPCLLKLVLYRLPVLSWFYPGKHHLECPILESLGVVRCPKLKLFTSDFHDRHKEEARDAPISQLRQPMFLAEKVAPKLEELALSEENIILLSDGRLRQDLLWKLKDLTLCFENKQKDTLPFDFFHKVPSLKHLSVHECYGLKEIFPSQKLHAHEGILAGLKKLTLENLEKLESIGLEYQWVKPYSENLQKLDIDQCPRLARLVCGAVSFLSLKELGVMDCEGMEYLFTFSTAKSLAKLEILDIEDCESIKEIVKKEDEDDSHDIIFGSLTTLILDSLPRLVRFYSGNATLQFSCLQTARVAKCPSMKTFYDGSIYAPSFDRIKTSMEDSDDLTFYNDLNTTIQWLFHQKVEKSACDIQHLEFGVVPIPIRGNFFNNLKSLIMVECGSLSRVIPFYLLRFLCNLKEIEVRNCLSVKAIFDVKDTEADMMPASQLSFPLKKLILNQLPNLEHIWNLNPAEILCFQNLQEVYIFNCQSLKSLFPISMVNHLVILDVRYCARLVEIFVEDEIALTGETKPFIFHCLTSLTLWKMPELKNFYPGKKSLEWPMLTHLDIYHCDKLKVFTSWQHNGEVADIEDQHQQAVFSVGKVFPNLVQLSLKKEDAMAILQGQFQVIPSLEHQEITKEDTIIEQGEADANAAHLLQNLKVLKLMCYHEDDESNIFSSGLLEETPSIENLEVVCSTFNEIFHSERPSTDCTKVLSKLKRLQLNNLQQLNSIGLEHPWVEPLLKTLETLQVFSCPCLKTLVPSTVSFSNLTSLSVSECHGLIYLFTSSTAKGLGQLQQLSIQNCQAIQEIVSKEGDHESNDEEITFEQLSVLSLESLPSMVGIYSGNSKLNFPSLDKVILMECPQMKYSYVADSHEFKPCEQI